MLYLPWFKVIYVEYMNSSWLIAFKIPTTAIDSNESCIFNWINFVGFITIITSPINIKKIPKLKVIVNNPIYTFFTIITA